jgi:CheY-like chemotaxis protein
MLIDDSEFDLLYGRLMIERSGIAQELLTFETAAEALRYLQRLEGHDVDIILLDINMPGMNGFEFLKAYQQLTEDEKASAVVVMLTSSPDPQDRLEAFRYDCVKGYVTKPLTLTAAQKLVQWVSS